MSTPIDFITEALEKIGYLAAETELESTDAQTAFSILNDMLSEWDATGILPGAAPVDGLSDVLRVPRYSHAAIKANLAGRCAAPFGQPITTELSALIRGSTSSLLSITAKIGDVKYPSTLPTGTGNQCVDFNDDRFFTEQNKANF